MVKRSRRATSSTHFKQMTNINITANTKKTGIKQAASLVAMAEGPLAIVMGVVVMNVPAADARVTCRQIGNAVYCR